MSLISDLESLAAEIFKCWDHGSEAGMLLTALEGEIRGYDPRVTRIRSALARQDDEAAASHRASLVAKTMSIGTIR